MSGEFFNETIKYFEFPKSENGVNAPMSKSIDVTTSVYFHQVNRLTANVGESKSLQSMYLRLRPISLGAKTVGDDPAMSESCFAQVVCRNIEFVSEKLDFT